MNRHVERSYHRVVSLIQAIWGSRNFWVSLVMYDQNGNPPNAVWRRGARLVKRSCTALREGGWPLFARRLRNWARFHQYARIPPSQAYQRWITQTEPAAAELARQRKWAETDSPRMLISVLCPLDGTPLPVLKQTVRSVLGQSYPFWELCLTLSQDESPALHKRVSVLTRRDPRIRVVQLARNEGISASSNAAFGAARGTFIALLNQGDVLAPAALFEVARHLVNHPESDVIHSDEDVLSADGRFRNAPVLKPGWSPETLLHFNYIGYLAVLRRSLLEDLGGFRSKYDGAHDWDILLRATERTDRVHRIPRILYHSQDPTCLHASSCDSASRIDAARQQVMRDGFQRRGLSIDLQPGANGQERPVWTVTDRPLVSIVIPSRNRPDLIRRCVGGILNETSYQNTEIIIVDNGSTDADVHQFYKELATRTAVTIVPFAEEFNYSVACNRGARAARGEFLLFLNNDIEVVHPDWLDELLRWGQQPGIGIVGARLLYPDGRVQHAGMVLGLFALIGHLFYQAAPRTASVFGTPELCRNVSAVTGACQFIRGDLFWRIGGFDEEFRLSYSDVTLCLKVRQLGYRVLYAPNCCLVHHEYSTRETSDDVNDARLFAAYLKRHHFKDDPFFHPSLNASSVIPQLKWPTARNVAANLRKQIASHLLLPPPAKAEDPPASSRAA